MIQMLITTTKEEFFDLEFKLLELGYVIRPKKYEFENNQVRVELTLLRKDESDESIR